MGVTPQSKLNIALSVPPTYSNDISTINSAPVKISKISFKDEDSIKSLEKEIGEPLSEYMPGSQKYTDRSSDVHVYDVGSLGKEMGLQLNPSKIISQVNETGCRTYTAYFGDGRNCIIKLTTKDDSPEIANKPLDATTLKNVVLRAIKICETAADSTDSTTGTSTPNRSSGCILNYDESTKTANFPELINGLSKAITERYQRSHPEAVNIHQNVLKKLISDFENQAFSMLDKIL